MLSEYRIVVFKLIVSLIGNFCIGVRLYFMTTTPERFEDPPSKLSLIHVRMPPGCAPSARPERPFMVHAAYYRQGNDTYKT